MGLTHVLMDAIDAQDSLTLKAQYPLAPVMATVGFLIVFFVDRESRCCSLYVSSLHHRWSHMSKDC